MKTITNRCMFLLVIALFTTFSVSAQNAADKAKPKTSTEMKTYVIERKIPGAGKLTQAELKSISQVSCGVLKEMGPQIQWMHSYVTGNKIYCIYKAANEDLVREHAKKGGFPANSVSEVANVINPDTAK